jgi:hypothetical protein
MAVKQNQLKTKTDITEVFEKAGISLKVTSNDLLDLIVAEKWKEIMHSYQGIKKELGLLEEQYNKEMKESFEKEIKSVKLDIKEIKDAVYVQYHYGSESLDIIGIPSITMNYSGSVIKLEKNNRSFTVKKKIKAKITATVGVFEIDGESTEKVTCSVSNKLIKRFEDYTKKAEEFFNTHDQLSLSKLKSAMKAELSRKVIENTPADFKKQLAESFNVII